MIWGYKEIDKRSQVPGSEIVTAQVCFRQKYRINMRSCPYESVVCNGLAWKQVEV